MPTNSLPSVRRSGIVDQSHDREILIYDLEAHKAYNLNETLAVVYQACNGKTTTDELKRRHHLSDDVIYLALDQLKENNLLEPGFNAPSLKGVPRREAIKRAGLASLVALPMLTSLVAPRAASASSLTDAICETPGGFTCADNLDCIGNVAYCSDFPVLSCACVLNCCVECSVGDSPAACLGVCVDLSNDPNNCGGCGSICSSGICINSTCIAPPE